MRVVASNGHFQASGKSGKIKVVANRQESKWSGMAVKSGESKKVDLGTINQFQSVKESG